ncbi:hypothetical protein CEXT_206781 [Caerostris extrusa]|uniref:Uncharacterized protein n=1 Tax=Caerostris extrusa TaxID=172846 RepID=A0AAV4RD26_CAEEX|nr:hypothetical protein CEXT_206781 [Caerostris extrusa]
MDAFVYKKKEKGLSKLVCCQPRNRDASLTFCFNWFGLTRKEVEEFIVWLCKVSAGCSTPKGFPLPREFWQRRAPYPWVRRDLFRF